jgi:putative hydrolase of the HAD superfamily
MKYEAVIFDLFGTLVKSFTRQEYDQVVAQMAKTVGIPFSDFWELMGEAYHNRSLGHYVSIEENLQDICFHYGVKADIAQITQAAKYHYEFMSDAIVPNQDVLEALGVLKTQGFKLGLIGNCGPEIPFLWKRSPLAPLIDIPVFSCEERVRKPSIGIFQTASSKLKVVAQKCIYIGDGSDEELTGAATIGMLPILKLTALNDVYDKSRPEVENWRGLAINEIRELPDMLLELEQPSQSGHQ